MNKTPKLRFKEFSGEWESKKLEDITSYVDYRGKTPPKSDNGVFLVTAKNIKNGYIDYDTSKEFISEESYEDAMRRGLPKKGDVLLTTEAPLGNVAQIDREDIALAQRVIKFRGTDELDNTYLKYYFLSEKFQNKLFTKAIGTTVLGIQGKVLHKMQVSFPIIYEQEKIASFISLIDNKISLQGEKVEKLKDYKKGMMQKIFSGELRFKDDEGREYPEWEEKKLGQVCDITMGQSPSSLCYNEDKIGIPLIQGNADIKNRKTAPRIYTSDITKTCDIGDIIMSVRAPVGAISKSLHNACIGRGVCSIKTKQNKEYIYQILLKSEDEWSKISQGSTFESVNSNDIKGLNILIPQLKEQEKIANFLCNIDLKIEKEQEKLNSLNEYKKGLLQQMFV